MTHSPNHIERTCDALPASVGELRRTAVAFAADHGATHETQCDIGLAVSEAATNAVLHAYRDGQPGAVHLEATAEPLTLDICVRDDGCGLRPRPDSPGMGLGLPLIARLADGLEVITNAGTAILMSFALAEGAPARAA